MPHRSERWQIFAVHAVSLYCDFPNDEEQNQFVAWHKADPSDEWERTWNERAFAVQGNRSPLASVGQ